MSNVKQFFARMVATNSKLTIYADKCDGEYFFILTAPNRDWIDIKVSTEDAHPELKKFADKLFHDDVTVDLISAHVPPSALSAIMLSLMNE